MHKLGYIITALSFKPLELNKRPIDTDRCVIHMQLDCLSSAEFIYNIIISFMRLTSFRLISDIGSTLPGIPNNVNERRVTGLW